MKAGDKIDISGTEYIFIQTLENGNSEVCLRESIEEIAIEELENE